MAAERADAGYEAVIGLEIHVQLLTATKLFCGCSTRFGDPPNVHTCPVCLGLPGALPVLNATALEYAVRAALALGCRVNPRSRFARKNYFYPDLPKGYQISQYEEPLAEDGSFAFDLGGVRRSVGIVRLHLEEDAGKSIHEAGAAADRTYIDLNRCGVPLVEIVTAPDLRSPEEAHAFLSTLRTTLRYLGITDANMEEGSLRCDANVSVRRRGAEELQPKTEIKNLNSFRFLRRALQYEVERQGRELEAGRSLVQGTRLWDERAGKTIPMRVKEEAHDYRYFPEPDLVPVVLEEARVRAAAGQLPELPLARQDRFVEQYGLPVQDAAVLVEDPDRADYFEAVVAAGADPVEAANWVRGEVLRVINERGGSFADFPIPAGDLAGLLAAVRSGQLSGKLAKQVFERMLESGRTAAEVVAEEGLEQIASTQALAPVVEDVLRRHPDEVAAYRAGRKQVLGYLMGQVMRATQGKANPQMAQQLLRAQLEG